jgi:hypothetical protein
MTFNKLVKEVIIPVLVVAVVVAGLAYSMMRQGHWESYNDDPYFTASFPKKPEVSTDTYGNADSHLDKKSYAATTGSTDTDNRTDFTLAYVVWPADIPDEAVNQQFQQASLNQEQLLSSNPEGTKVSVVSTSNGDYKNYPYIDTTYQMDYQQAKFYEKFRAIRVGHLIYQISVLGDDPKVPYFDKFANSVDFKLR